MANEQNKDFNAMLRNCKDMPKIQYISDPISIKKYGGDKMYFAPPMDYDAVMRLVPYGKVITLGEIRAFLQGKMEQILPTLLLLEFSHQLLHGLVSKEGKIQHLIGER